MRPTVRLGMAMLVLATAFGVALAARQGAPARPSGIPAKPVGGKCCEGLTPAREMDQVFDAGI